MMTVYVKAIGKLSEQALEEIPVTLPQGANLQDLLNKLGIKTEDVMLAFVNGAIARPASVLTPECQVHLSPFICGG